jgi:hypothetical protein
MTTTTFVNGTVIQPAWLNDVDELIYNTDLVRPVNIVTDHGADNTGVVGASTAIQAAITAGGFIYIPDGTYLIDADLTVTNNKIIWFSKGAVFKASANNRIIFKSTVSAYFSQIWNATLVGNGFTGVVGFDMTNMRLQAGLFNCNASDMATGFISRTGNFGTQILNLECSRVAAPIVVIANSSVLDIIHPSFDNSIAVGGSGAGIGIDIQAGAADNLGVRVVGGFIQGFATGVKDAGIGTKITDTYFEVCSAADISGSATRGCTYSGVQHFGPSGAAGVKLRNCDATTIFNPTMASGARTALYDVDSSNTNCTEYRTASNASYNTPTGTLTYLGVIPTQTKGTFTPVGVGSGTAGTWTYTTQSGKWSLTGNVAHVDLTLVWTAIGTGAGNITVTGIPSGLTPASFTPQRTLQVTVNGVAFTGPLLWAVLNGTNANLTLQQADAAGTVSLVPVDAAGSLHITGSWEL